MTELRLPPSRSASAALALALVLGVATMAQAQPVLNPPQVSGPNITLTWSASPAATSYNLLAGLTPGVWLITHPVGPGLSTAVTAPAPGAYWVAIQAVDGATNPVSTPVQVVVTSMFVPPVAPTNLEVFFDGRTAHFSWAAGVGGGAPLGYVLRATSGGVPVATMTVNATNFSVANVPAGAYNVTVTAVNQGGESAPSAAVDVNMPAQGICSTPPARGFNTFSFGRFAQFTWAPVPGAAGFSLAFTTAPGGAPQAVLPVSGSTSYTTVRNAPFGTFWGKLTTAFACGTTATGPEQEVLLDGRTPIGGTRTPDPAPGQRLSLPGYGAGVVAQLARERPDLVQQSCREHGGNNRFMFEAVRRLRQRDTRWGLNWKRGNNGDLSQDIVNYNYGSEPDEGTRNVYIIDIIAGHCGSRPGPNWADQTGPTRNAGTVGVWTLIPYIEGGYPIVP